MINHFKILSLTIYEGCNQSLLKALKEGVEYKFYQDQDFAPSWLYDIPNGPKVSVSSIVGKNGSGKSSIIEMMIRVMNNFAFLAGYRENQSSLKFIPKVRASIKYSVKGEICRLTCHDDTVLLDIPGRTPLEFVLGKSKGSNKKQRLAEVKDYLLYMFVSNYSLNSFNSRDFIGETDYKQDDWLTPLFHKNDGYQTPVNINPMRTDGQININQEHELSKQRLMSLFTEATEKQVEGVEKNNPYGVPTGEGFIFKLSGESKLEAKTFSEYFFNHRGVRHSESKIDFDYEKHLSFWARNAAFILDKIDFIDAVYKLLSRYNNRQSDFSLYLSQLKELLTQHKEANRNQLVMRVIKTLMNYPKFTFLEFQRIFLVIWIERRWEQEHMVKKAFDLNSIYVRKDHLRVNAQKYIIYKTVSIFETYPLLYDGCIGKIEKPVNFFAWPSDENGFERRMEIAFCKLMEDVKKDKSFITLKIRQCINYINHFSDYESWNIPPERKEYSVPGKEYTHYVSFVDLLADIRKNTKGPVIDFLPPPIFEGEIILRSGEKIYPTSQISSGERQMLNMVGAVVYHLRNLGTALDKNRSFRYKNIHVCLDEIELCFHPAYQRDLVNYLLGQIAAAHLPEDMRLSISLLSHSPFVLSDIPQGNILYLKNGRPANDGTTVNPFAANVNDILQQSFFMEDGFTGKYATAKINSLISFLSPGDENVNQVARSVWHVEEIEQFISIIGEPLMKSGLLKLFMNWKIRSGLFSLEDEKRRVEELARSYGGVVKW